MNDLIPFAGMIFSLLVILIIAGSILLYPLSTRLGKLLELRIEERKEGAEAVPEALQTLERTVSQLESQVQLLVERQQFMERLLEGGDRERAPSQDHP